MSFYNTQTLPTFNVKDPILSLTKNVLALQTGIVQPVVSTITNNSGVTYTAQQVLNGSIVRLGSTPGTVTDTFPSAAAIVSEMENILTKIKGYQVRVAVGDNFPLVIVNNTPNDLQFSSGSGVLNTFSTVNSEEAYRAQLIVINLDPIQIYIDNL